MRDRLEEIEQAGGQLLAVDPHESWSAKALLDETDSPSEEEVRFHLAGNLCRCTGYDKIVRAVFEAAGAETPEL